MLDDLCMTRPQFALAEFEAKKIQAYRNNLVCDLAERNASIEEIEKFNILEATFIAMNRAIDGLDVKADFALIDGNCSRGFEIPTETVVKGDAKSASIAAASILAKVTRDRQCLELDSMYPQYGIAKHKGYPTKDHMDAVRTHGPSPIHRKTFLKFLEK